MNGKQYSEFRVRNKKLFESLLRCGVEIKKSLTLDIGEIIQHLNLSNELIPSILLGYFDGDGGIYHYQPNQGTQQFSCSVTGTLETCKYYKNYFQTGFLTKRNKESDVNNYTYQIGGRNKVRESLSQLYESKSDFFLKRKHDVFLKTSRLV